MGETDISWTHRPGTVGRTWNPTQGCSRASTGCEHCYAERMAARFANDGWSQGLINLKTRKWNGEVRLAEHKLADPLRWRSPSTVFVNSMSDLFHEKLTNEQIAAVFGVMAAAPKHTFQILTKRAKRMREWFEWALDGTARGGFYDATYLNHLTSKAGLRWEDHPKWLTHCESTEDTCSTWPLRNAWIGVSVENQAAADERIPELLATPAAVRFLSCEPLLGPVDLMCHLRCPSCGYSRIDCNEHLDHNLCGGPGPRLSWVIAGCESGPGARPCSVEWLRSLSKQCSAAGVPYFVKQMFVDGKLRKEMSEFPDDLQRMEFPS